MSSMNKLLKNLKAVEEKIHLGFVDKNLLLLSFVHSSFVNENKKIVNDHNERLEFLGDSILNLIISEYLYLKFPSYPEGKLSHIRSNLINANVCAKYYSALGLNEYVLLGKGEKILQRGKKAIYADAFEALIGAIYLDKGWEIVKNFVIDNFKSFFEKEFESPEMDYKSLLQDFSQKNYHSLPEYVVVKQEGPEHLKIFYTKVLINGQEMGFGKGNSKKQSQMLAAEDAYKKLTKEEKDG